MLEIRRLSVAEAHVLIEGSVAASREINVPMCIAVVDESGNLIAFERMDGGKISSISIAVDKASTAAKARERMSTISSACPASRPSVFMSPMTGISASSAGDCR